MKMLFLFTAPTALFMAQMAPALFGLWSGIFLPAFAVFVIAYWGCRAITVLGGVLALLVYEIILGQALGDMAVPFLATCLLFYFIIHFFQIHPFEHVLIGIYSWTRFLVVASIIYVLFSGSSSVWYILNGYTDVFKIFWLIREPQHSLYMLVLALLVYLACVRIVVRHNVQA